MPPKAKRSIRMGRNSRPAKKTKTDERYNDPHQILEDDKSPLYMDDSNIKGILTHEKAQEAVGDIFKGVSANDVNNSIALFKDGGKEGRYDLEWIRQAVEASMKRDKGEFDDYLKAKFADEWADEGGEELSDDEDGGENLSGDEDGGYKIEEQHPSSPSDELDELALSNSGGSPHESVGQPESPNSGLKNPAEDDDWEL